MHRFDIQLVSVIACKVSHNLASCQPPTTTNIYFFGSFFIRASLLCADSERDTVCSM